MGLGLVQICGWCKIKGEYGVEKEGGTFMKTQLCILPIHLFCSEDSL